ncbi:uncharacterized protein LOC120110650 [Phoenix dactylifera]|uniref:Uncharacterized protein LOC120110650 n=1 Tax=Phoenix dactylifera TaxID=42345 RepID=A0A8B9A8W3_PHODC|nr:uncharacterized protein LOC120110650 [Phoenix dactylifera]
MEKHEAVCINFTRRNYSTWEFQFQTLLQGKKLWGYIDGSIKLPAETEVEKRAEWIATDPGIRSWILKSVDSHIVLSLRSYSTAKQMWDYLKLVFNHDNNARRYQLELEIANFFQGNLSIQEYYSGFLNLWTEYSGLIQAKVPAEGLAVVHQVHAASQKDQFLMRLRLEFEATRSALLNREVTPSLVVCLG